MAAYEKMLDVGPVEIYNSIKAQVLNLLRRTFRPEFLNRIDEVVVFKPLSEHEIRGIVELEFAEIQRRLLSRGLSATLAEKAAVYLAKEGYDPQFGARPLKRAVKRYLTDRIANFILSGNLVAGDMIIVDVDTSGLTFRTEAGLIGKT
jgi:ATP-dependent Clp protease ATP-binding subunit ClpC